MTAQARQNFENKLASAFDMKFFRSSEFAMTVQYEMARFFRDAEPVGQFYVSRENLNAALTKRRINEGEAISEATTPRELNWDFSRLNLKNYVMIPVGIAGVTAGLNLMAACGVVTTTGLVTAGIGTLVGAACYWAAQTVAEESARTVANQFSRASQTNQLQLFSQIDPIDPLLALDLIATVKELSNKAAADTKKSDCPSRDQIGKLLVSQLPLKTP
jgi:hypothetical protein